MKKYQIYNTDTQEPYTDTVFDTLEEAQAKLDFYSEPYLKVAEVTTKERFLTAEEVEAAMAEVTPTLGQQISVKHRSAGTWRIECKGFANIPTDGATWFSFHTETHNEEDAENLDLWEMYFVDRLEEWLGNYRIVEVVR